MNDVNQFEPLLALQQNWQTIAEEARNLHGIMELDVAGKSRTDIAMALIASGKAQWIKGWDGCDKWLNWGIGVMDQYPLGDAGMPKTVELLKGIKGISYVGISLLRGGALLPIHEHPENKQLLTFHLGLDVPKNCYLHVDDEFISEENGKCIVFDGTKPHYAFNASSEDRVIFYCEFLPEIMIQEKNI